MKILYLSQYFPPEMGAPAARVYEFSREWVRMGHQVTVLTGFPNHPTGVIPEEYRGELFRREVVDGIQVVRTPIYAAANRGMVRRIANYLSYSASASTFGPLLTELPDVVIATSPQFLTGVAGLWLSLLRRRPFVFEVRDIWPQSIVEVGAMKAGSLPVLALEQLEQFLYRKADHIVVVTESFVDTIAQHGIPRGRISVVTNGVDLELFRPQDKAEAKRKLGLEGRFLATYIGTHGMAHGLDTLVDAAKQLGGSGVQILLVGEGAEKAKLMARVRAEGITGITFWDQRPRDQVAQIIAATDLCLVLLKDKPLFRTVIPSKIFEYMGAARPILTTVDGESRAIIERAQAGTFCPPENPQALSDALREQSRDLKGLEVMGSSGRRFVEQHYSREALARSYSEVLNTLVSSRHQPTVR